VADVKPSGLNRPSLECDALDRQMQELDRLGRRLHLELVGQLADLGFWIAAVPAQGL
jgi:hypothetical protein